MYRWRKFASSQWLMRHEASLQRQTSYGLAVIQSPNHKRLRLEVSSSSRQMVQSLLAGFGGAIERWPRNWRRCFAVTAKIKPLRIGTRLSIRSTRKNVCENRQTTRQLIIPAAGAFGTGEHATTAMCLRLLERVSHTWPDGWSMLDAGTGSGILALAARYLGAGDVMAIDTDPRAIIIAQGNARLNRIGRVQFKEADATKLKTRCKFDVIVANLFSDLLIAAIPAWCSQVNNERFLILSGVLRSQEREVLRALRKNRFTLEEIRKRGKWVAILAQRQKAG
jgi:ribosomal protein L11 methyltransferase